MIYPDIIKVSVIVITYNQETTIARTLESILKQNCNFKYEIIIGEDCSSDKTLSICKKYKERFPDIITIIANPHNKGLNDNYFDCVLACNGKYIADCAGDDYWVDPFKLQKQVDILDNNDDISLVHSNWVYINDKTKEISVSDNTNSKFFQQSEIPGEQLFQELLNFGIGQPIHLCSAMFRRDIFIKEYDCDQFLFRNKHFSCEDLPIVFTMAAHGKIAYIPDITLHYTIGHESISHTPKHSKTFDFCIGLLKLHTYLRKKYNIGPSIYPQNELKFLHYTASQAFHGVDSTRRKEFIDFINAHNIHLLLKTRILLFFSSYLPIWKMIVWLKKLIS